MAHRARKRFSQNFLVDQLVIDRIIETIAPKPGEHMVEIGPGLGAITRPLSRIVRPLHAVEVDRDIVRTLRAEFPPSELIVHEGDALQFDFGALGPQLRVVGNLPYHISTPILFHLSESVESLRDIHVMLQAEVVDRMLAEPGSAEYGRLSVMLQYLFDMEKVLDVPNTAFRPRPKVESAVVRMLPRTDMRRARDDTLLSATVALAFSQRRKTLRNTLGRVLSSHDFEALHIDPQARAQTLTVEQFVAVADYREARAHEETSGSAVRS
jgi:16S rRNA (adenine1518-N6/adenine1519-N6)-dimethyltransferase